MVNAMLGTDLRAQWDVRHVATHRDGSAPAKMATFAVGAVRFVGMLLVDRPRIVHIHTSSYGSFVRKAALVWIARALRIPVVLHVHGAEFHIFFARLPRPLRALARRTLTTCSTVIALGPGWARRLAEMAPDARIVVIPNAVSTADPVTQPAPGETLRVLFLGRVGVRKGTFDLIEAWAASRADGHGMDAHLTIAGDGDVNRARALVAARGVSDSVDVVGWVDPSSVPALIAGSHVLVLPSHDEGQPMALLEAMAHGLGVITTRVGGIPDLVDDTGAVFVTPGDVAGLTRALGTLLDDRDARVRLGRSARDRVHETFDVEVVWRRIDALYRDLVTA